MDISVITPSYNPGPRIDGLIASLRAQSARDFEWHVVDGGSTDGTVERIRECTDLSVRLSVEPDFGIYDALNRGIRRSASEYYLTVGADDRLRPDAIANYAAAQRRTHADIISAAVETDDGRLRPGRGRPWLHGHLAFISQHSVGALIRRSLHQRFGYYSPRFPIAADMHFILKACTDPSTRLSYEDFVAGSYGVSGVSTTDVAGGITESYRVQVELRSQVMLQTTLLILRLLRNARRLRPIKRTD